MTGRRRCPQCAERVRREAMVCRYCGAQLNALEAVGQDGGIRRAQLLGGGAVLVALAALGVAYLSFREMPTIPIQAANAASAPAASQAPVLKPDTPAYPALAVGETLEWTANAAFDTVARQAGPYVLEVAKRTDGELAAPVLKLTAGGQTITLEGEMAQTGFPNKITLLNNRQGAVPVVMLQSFSGGAHCCNHVQLAGFSAGRLKVVDLGSWDGDDIPVPTDVSHDGVADFVMRDNRFLYAFASYAESYAPPQIFNVVGGKLQDVSRKPAFRGLYVQEMSKAGQICKPGLGSAANGACPSFVAAAARIGKLDEAWVQMLSAYDASTDWTLPRGCWLPDQNGCPSGQEIKYKSYPEALQAFLVKAGYISPQWIPPERRNQVPSPATPIEDSHTA